MNEKRQRIYFLTINLKAKCYESFINNLDKCQYYAYIKHNKDTTEEGELKAEHIHLVVKYKNSRTLSAIQKDFEGAHIEIANNIVSCIKYLVHQTTKSKEDGKYQYTLEDIITSDKTYTEESINARDIEPFDSNEILTYINEGCRDLIDFYLRFGSQINPYTRLIEKLIRAYTMKTIRNLTDIDVSIKEDTEEEQRFIDTIDYED